MIEPMNDAYRSRLPGPRRPTGSPAGPDEVRRAVLDAAAELFALRGVDAVSLRDIAAAADVHLSLIRRYIGSRDDLVAAVFHHASDQLALAVEENPLSGQGFSADTVMGKWVRIAAALVISGRSLESRPEFNPVVAMAETLMAGYGLDAEAARVRAAQIVATALGWGIFEDYLVQAGGLDAIPLVTLRDELTRSARRLGATPWPSPPDPEPAPAEPADRPG
jgi:TetR/AcrR family transcriptional regulator, repressor for neighboring sulfatase